VALPKTVKDAHPRTFPGGAFVPSGLRPVNREVLRACFVNALFEVSNKGLDAAQIRQAAENSVLQGDPASIQYALAVMDDVLFPRSKSFTGNTKPTFRITHPGIGRAFTPDQHYGAPEWIRAFFKHAGFSHATLKRLRVYLETATQRPLNVLELAGYEAVIELTQGSAAKSLPLAESPVTRLAPSSILEQFRDLLESRVATADALGHAEGPLEAESVIFDIARAYDIHLWFYWVQMYLNAWSALGALHAKEAIVNRIHPIHFGYHTERSATKGRPFATERARLEDEVYKGALASIALANVHAALDLDHAYWFTDLPALDDETGVHEETRLVQWLETYKRLVTAEKGRDLEVAVPAALRPSAAVTKYYDAIAEFYRGLDQNSRMPYTTTYGVVRSLGCSDDHPLLINLGSPRGLVTMIDHSIILLIGRMVSRGEKRVRFSVIIEQLERLGMILDDTTRERIVADLEQKGLLQSLSDSGEAVYVQVY
jgi:hypothetical protein